MSDSHRFAISCRDGGFDTCIIRPWKRCVEAAVLSRIVHKIASERDIAPQQYFMFFHFIAILTPVTGS